MDVDGLYIVTAYDFVTDVEIEHVVYGHENAERAFSGLINNGMDGVRLCHARFDKNGICVPNGLIKSHYKD